LFFNRNEAEIISGTSAQEEEPMDQKAVVIPSSVLEAVP
jgi:hypothetical protein